MCGLFMCGFCNVWMFICLGFVMCVWVCVWVFNLWKGGREGGFVMCWCFGNNFTYIYCGFVLFRLCIFILICFVSTSVRTAATQ